jgi:hypothetical protein
MITKKTAILCTIKDAEAVAFFNLYDEGDIWEKIKGCLDCPKEQRIHCCGRCPCIMPNGDCYWHSPDEVQHSRKSLYCMMTPIPTKHNSRCCIEYKCIEGLKKGKIRRLRDKLNVFIEQT